MTEENFQPRLALSSAVVSCLQDASAELASLTDAGFLHELLLAKQRYPTDHLPAVHTSPSWLASLQTVTDGMDATAALMAQAVKPATAAAQQTLDLGSGVRIRVSRATRWTSGRCMSLL